jgi:glycosyltransferase involved in cell wall biosynthesis
MSHGTPVIASDIPIFREVGDDAVSYVHADSSSEFAGAVRELEDPDLWKARSRRSVERAADFSWDESARRLVAVAEEAVALRSRNKS